LKKTDPQDQDYGYLKAALSEIDIIIKSINEHTRRRDEIARLLEIGNQLDCSLIKIVFFFLCFFLLLKLKRN